MANILSTATGTIPLTERQPHSCNTQEQKGDINKSRSSKGDYQVVMENLWPTIWQGWGGRSCPLSSHHTLNYIWVASKSLSINSRSVLNTSAFLSPFPPKFAQRASHNPNALSLTPTHLTSHHLTHSHLTHPRLTPTHLTPTHLTSHHPSTYFLITLTTAPRTKLSSSSREAWYEEILTYRAPTAKKNNLLSA